MSDGPEGRTRVGAYARCLDGERMLLCRIAESDAAAGYWTLPGGGIDFGEHPGDAVLRELTEETGLVGEVEGLLSVESHHWPGERTADGRPFHAISAVYAVRIVGGELRDEADGSTDRAAWIDRETIATLPLTRLARAVLALEPVGRDH